MSIKQIQSLLTYLGYDPGTVDGYNGPNTSAAVKAFQAAEGLSIDGDAGSATQAALLDAIANGRFAGEETDAETTSDTTDSDDDFWKGIPYFDRSEFACKCGGKYCNGYPVEISQTLVLVAERVREHFNSPVIVSSGIRCTQHNAAVGGVTNSRHLLGHAMDYCVRGYTATEVLAYALAQPEIVYAYAIDDNYVHMDIGA